MSEQVDYVQNIVSYYRFVPDLKLLGLRRLLTISCMCSSNNMSCYHFVLESKLGDVGHRALRAACISPE